MRNSNCYVDEPVILFTRESCDGDRYINRFSVESTGSTQVSSRAIVTHEGTDTGIGQWMCTKDGGGSCTHINAARNHLQDLLQSNMELGDDAAEGVGGSGSGTCVNAAEYKLATHVRKRNHEDIAVSYLPILPPAWAGLPSDKELYKRPAPVRTIPSLLPLVPTSSCLCASGQTLYDATAPSSKRVCTVYTLTEPLKTEIQIQKCPKCPVARHRFIGPDLRELGIFNYNNAVLFTHELLDEYTSSFTTSETPFVAWSTVVSRRYTLGGHSFVSNAMLRSVWFAYVRIQLFDGDMQCVRCGPSPEHIIWDGVTLSFGRKHVLPSLNPPTQTAKSSPIRENRRYIRRQQILEDRETRDLVRKAATMPKLPKCLAAGPPAARVESVAPDKQKAANDTVNLKAEATAALDHIDRVTRAGNALAALSKGLGALFCKNYGVAAFECQIQPPPSCRLFFDQVSNTICLPSIADVLWVVGGRGIGSTTSQPSSIGGSEAVHQRPKTSQCFSA